METKTVSKKPGGWPADMEARRAAGYDGIIEGLPPIECAPDDPERFIWGDDNLLDGYEFRCRKHPGQETFIASVPGMMDPDVVAPEGGFNAGNEPDSVDFQVRKNGENTNLFSDGTVGVPEWAHDFHDMCDTTDINCAQVDCYRYAELWDLRRNKWRKL